MSNHMISHGKTVYDIFNMINPNCYQAFIMQYIIENRKEEAIKCCEELEIAFEYYKWDTSGKQSSYVDSLICESNLDKWQKVAIIHIIANDVKSCKKAIQDELDSEKKLEEQRIASAKLFRDNPTSSLDNLFDLFGFGQML